MAIELNGPGKYDDLCTIVRERSKAKGTLVAVIDGNKGTGFSIQATADVLMRLPGILRSMADDMERGMRQ